MPQKVMKASLDGIFVHSAVARILAAGFVVAAIPVLAGAGEPNDTLSSATPLGIEGEGRAVVGGFLGDGVWLSLDVDLYSLQIPEGTDHPIFLSVEVERGDPSLDAFLRVFDQERLELVNNDDQASDTVDPQIRTYLLEPGTYYVGVSSTGNPFYDPGVEGSGMPRTTGPYRLTVVTEAAPFPDSLYEPNDEKAEATDMGTGSFEVIGEFIGDGVNRRRDDDWYVIHPTLPAVIEVTVRAEQIGSTLDPVVLVGRQGGESIWPSYTLGASEDHDGSTDAAVLVAIMNDPAFVRDVYIRVSGSGRFQRRPDPFTADPVGSVGNYNLYVQVAPFDAAGEGEPNDSVMIAPEVDLDEEHPRTIDGFIGDGPYHLNRGDRDFYRVQPFFESGIVNVEIEPAEGSDLDPVLAVFDIFGNRLAAADNSGGGRGARLLVPSPCSAFRGSLTDIFVLVMGTGQRFPNDPQIPGTQRIRRRVEEFIFGDGPGSTGAYQLRLSIEGRSCLSEANETMDSATDTGIVDEGFFVCSQGRGDDGPCPIGRDVDMFKFVVEKPPAFLHVVDKRCESSSILTTVRVFDGEGMDITQGVDRTIDGLLEVRAAIDHADTYYLGVSSIFNDDYDPREACSGSGERADNSEYDLVIEVVPGVSRHRGVGAKESEEGGATQTLFATRLGTESGVIDVIDPDSGQITGSFAAPEPVSGGAEGLAYDGSDLFFVGAGRFPNMYRMDPVTGEVIEKHILWSGSGFYSDAVMLGGELFLMDFFDNRLHVIDPVAPRLLRSMSVGAINDIRISGGMGALSKPNRLYVADAFGSGDIHEIRPDVGTVTGTFRAEAVRPTALAGVGTRTLYAADWQGREFESIDRFGEEGVVLSLPHRIGSLGGAVATGLFGDFNEDGDIDLDDFARFQSCFTGEGGDLKPGCEPGDANDDNAIDASDYAAFGQSLTGP